MGEKTGRLLLILEEIGADKYISGPAAKDYIEINGFRERSIELYWYEYQHPVYPQIRGNSYPIYQQLICCLILTMRR